MSIAHLLEDFDVNSLSNSRVFIFDEDTIEEHRLAAFEQGYSAGWEDAVAVRSDEHSRLSAELIKSLDDMSFTYHEALSGMSLSLEPMFHSLLSTVLPNSIEQSFLVKIVEQLRSMAVEQIGQPAFLSVPVGVGASVTPLLDREFSFPIQLVEDPAMPPGQATLKVGVSEREVDCSQLSDLINDAMSAFFVQTKEVSQNA